MIRSANAVWNGNLKQGNGTLNTESGVLKDTNYSFAKRFDNEKGANPEELLGAAHAGCYSMALANALSEAGHKVKSIKTADKVHLEGLTITKIEVNCQAEVEGIDEAGFQKFAEEIKKGCPVSKALSGVEFILKATLISA